MLNKCRADEVREKFERFGEIRDVYLPRDYYTGYEIPPSSEPLMRQDHQAVRAELAYAQEQDSTSITRGTARLRAQASSTARDREFQAVLIEF